MKVKLIIGSILLLTCAVGAKLYANDQAYKRLVATHPRLTTPAPAPRTCYADSIAPEAIVSLTNAERARYGLSPLALDTRLSQGAALKGADMLASHYWAHVSPTGVTPWYWFDQVGYRYVLAGENLAETQRSPEQVMREWMASPGHRANILKPFRDIGVYVGCGVTDRATTLVVVEYGS